MPKERNQMKRITDALRCDVAVALDRKALEEEYIGELGDQYAGDQIQQRVSACEGFYGSYGQPDPGRARRSVLLVRPGARHIAEGIRVSGRCLGAAAGH